MIILAKFRLPDPVALLCYHVSGEGEKGCLLVQPRHILPSFAAFLEEGNLGAGWKGTTLHASQIHIWNISA